MEIKMISQKKNPFLEREEIIFEIKSDSAPSFEQIKKEIGKNENLTVIKRVDGNFGTHTFTAEIFVYDSPEARKKIETIPKKIKKKMAEEEKTKKQAEKKAAQEAKKQAEQAAESATEELKEEITPETTETKTEEGQAL